MKRMQIAPRVLCVVGARPNFIKIAPTMRALRAHGGLDARLLHTGQHYDAGMNDVFFDELGIPRPDIALGVGSATHAQQTAAVMSAIEPAMDEIRPDILLVVGDVNSTLAAALVAAKKGIRVAHVEAGLRSFDRTMPEEINRVLTDQLSNWLFTTEAAALENLAVEGIPRERVHFVGNVMIDSLYAALPRAQPATTTFATAGTPASLREAVADPGFALLTLHRPSNVDDPEVLVELLGTVAAVAERLPVVFPVHPRTQAAIERAGLQASLAAAERVLCLPPAPYLTLLGLMQDARLVLTDSGGVQEETTGLGVPCLTLRDNTERPITVEQGTNTIVGRDRTRILAEVDHILATGGKAGYKPPLWDGRAAERIVDVLADACPATRSGAFAVAAVGEREMVAAR